MSQIQSIVVNTDSYKVSMFDQYPPGTTNVFSYIESRGGDYDKTLFFGLQMFVKEYLQKPFTQEQIDFAEKFYAVHGEPFNKAGWEAMLAKYGGYLPVRIRALKEGTVIPVSNAMVTIENIDPEFRWVTTWVETALLRGIWYPTTVATQSWSIKQRIKGFLEETGDVGGLAFKLHDFGARGVSSLESAAIGGAAHLVNFLGSDTVSGAVALMEYYNAPVSAFSIPAAEHSTITSWGRDNEVEAYRNMLKKFGGEGKLLAVVSDSYDIYNACKLWGTELKQEVIDSKAIVVIRPDSGVPVDVVAGRRFEDVADLDDYTLLGVNTDVVRVNFDKYYEIESYDTGWTTKFTIKEIREEEVLGVVRTLAKYFGFTVNDKGYNVLNNVRVIQGDGINEKSITQILERLTAFGWSADNVAFGMGGALLQIVNRDTQKFAMKCSAAKVNDEWIDVFKDPITDSGKRSKKGRLTTVERVNGGKIEFLTIRISDLQCYISDGWTEALETVWVAGKLLRDENLEEIRARSNQF
jgi:nicotinamide phosphoribosyltransferase